jgi:predicted methyltransferase
MKKGIAAALAALTLAACSSMSDGMHDDAMHDDATAAGAPSLAHIEAAVAAESRPAEDRARDAARKPADILAFAGVEPGDRIADLIPAGGYFTRVLAGAAGEAGRVYAVIPPAGASEQDWAGMIAPAAAAHTNVVVSPQNYMQMTFPEPLDMVFTAQNYHDMHIARYGLNAAEINQAVFNALKPGGTYLIIDHSAVDGADMSVPEALHRIDQAAVRAEVEAAGFEFVGASEVLRNPDDPRTASVFDPAIRGRTDQFVLRFRKPAS